MSQAGFSSTFKVMEDRRSAAAAVCGGCGWVWDGGCPPSSFAVESRSLQCERFNYGAIKTAFRVFLSGQRKNFGHEERKFMYLHFLYFVSQSFSFNLSAFVCADS